jgi:hypothetical protein
MYFVIMDERFSLYPRSATGLPIVQAAPKALQKPKQIRKDE